jgi:phenylacetic acid degradation operon negative regulatory protein
MANDATSSVRDTAAVDPKRVVFDLFGDHLRYRPGPVRTQALVDLLAAFGVGEPTARIVLTRMRRQGWFDTDRDGRHVGYRLTAKALEMLDAGRERIFERSTSAWDRTWRVVVYTTISRDRAERDQLRRTLAWLGFGPLAPATWISPHDHADEVERAAANLRTVSVHLLTARSRGYETDRDMVKHSWDLTTLADDYRAFVRRLHQLPRADELAKLPGVAALRLRVQLVSEYRQFPFRDPDLPEELLPAGWPGTDAHRLFTSVHDALAAPVETFVDGVLERYVG